MLTSWIYLSSALSPLICDMPVLVMPTDHCQHLCLIFLICVEFCSYILQLWVDFTQLQLFFPAIAKSHSYDFFSQVWIKYAFMLPLIRLSLTPNQATSTTQAHYPNQPKTSSYSEKLPLNNRCLKKVTFLVYIL